jgi:hypothetical protein
MIKGQGTPEYEAAKKQAVNKDAKIEAAKRLLGEGKISKRHFDGIVKNLTGK